MIVGADNVAHAADIRVVDECDNSSLSSGAYLFGMISSFTVLGVAMFISRLARDDFDGNLRYVNTGTAVHKREGRLTCSPVSLLRASFTLPMLPAPIVFPRSQWPVVASMVVRRRTVEPAAAAALCELAVAAEAISWAWYLD